MPKTLVVPTWRNRLLDRLSRWPAVVLLSIALSPAASAATIGTVVPIGGHASDIALDEARGVVYVANYTANRIEVVSTRTRSIERSINVAPQPASLALSPDGRYLVITHLSNFETPNNSVTVLDLSGDGNVKRTFAFGTPPLGVAFGKDGLALIATTTDLLLFDPGTGEMISIDTVPGVTAKALPVPAPTFPRAIIRASMGVSADGETIVGTLEAENAEAKAVVFEYSVPLQQVAMAVWTAEPPLGPRVVSVDQNGSRFMTGWGLFHRAGFLLAQFPEPSGIFDIGSHVIDSARKIAYAQVTQAAQPETPAEPVCSTVGGVQVCVTPPATTTPTATPAGPPVLQVVDWDNLTVRERLQLPENLTGRSLLSSSGEVIYGVSDSGLLIIPVGPNVPRVTATQEDVLFRGSWCERRIMTQEINIVNPNGGQTDFRLSTTMPGVTFSPASGTTPANVKVMVDMNVFRNEKGTVSGLIEIQSSAAVNLPSPVRVLVNNREPDQRGTLVNIPGVLVDVLADPVRDRFYVLRQDKNQVLVYNSRNYTQMWDPLRTGNTPTSMAITFDKRYLIVGANNSQVAHVYNLDSLAFEKYIVFPSGHYPRSIAVSGAAILTASRVAGPEHTVDQIDFAKGIATTLPTLGVYENKIDGQAVLSSTPSGSSILMAEPTGRVMLYEANADTWVAARQDVKELSGAYAALSDERFVVGNILMNASLVKIQTFESASGLSSGFALVDGMGLRTTAPTQSSAGVIQRVNLSAPIIARPTRTSEAPVLATKETGGGFVRTLAPLPNRNGILSLSTSGLTVLPWEYDAAVADPLIQKVVSAADGSSGVAPGGLISIIGKDLAPVNLATSEIPLPTALGDSCMTVNGVLVPITFVSPTLINGQLPVDVSGKGTMVLRTPAGVSNTFTFNIQPAAPAAFHVDVQGWDTKMPTVVRATNNLIVTPTNPIHLDDWLVIYLTGLGATTPSVGSGMPGPGEPGLAETLEKPNVTLGGVPLPVAFAGLVPGEVGMYQINALVPFKEVPTGMEIPLTISQGAYTTTVNVRVVK